ncbi:Protein insensitive [Amphibalanus amphitrite]|uniref:Protein insensitive n=1 Tax=Amphibalanus amphitrite TaxID=1232801 RepID=A0A6A4W2T8_AMPAM|nr:Protein insensitive [Amphibalanus amphitrite]
MHQMYTTHNTSGLNAKKFIVNVHRVVEDLVDDDHVAPSSAVISKKAAQRQHEKSHSLEVLREVQTEQLREPRDCIQCKEKDEIIGKLRKQIEVLQDINITSNSKRCLTLLVTIGPFTAITSAAFCLINFDDKKKAIRDMMMAVFGKEVLGSSSMRGQACPLNKNKGLEQPTRPALDQGKLRDVITFLVNRLKMTESEVKDVIRKKINDENSAALKAKKRAEQGQ